MKALKQDVLLDIPISHIKIKENVRKEYNLQRLKELASSIHTNGLLQPICVKQITPKSFEVVFGHRRFKALGILKKRYPKKYTKVKAFIQSDGGMNEDEVKEVQLIENMQRHNLSFTELKSALMYFKNKHLSYKQIAKKLSKKEAYVKNLFSSVNTINDNPDLEDLVASSNNKISFSDVQEVKSLPKSSQVEVLKDKLKGNITSQQALRMRVKALKENVTPSKPDVITISEGVVRIRAFSIDLSTAGKTEVTKLRKSLEAVLKVMGKA